MNTKMVLLALVAMASLSTDATLMTLLGGGAKSSGYGYSANQEKAPPTLGSMIGAKIDGIKSLKGMLLSPFLMIATSLLSAKGGGAPAAAPAPAPAPPPAAESYGSNYGSYSNVNQETSYAPKTESSNLPTSSSSSHMYGDTGRPAYAYAGGDYYDGASYDNYGRSGGGVQPDYISKRTGSSGGDFFNLQFGSPYHGDNFGSASSYGGDYYGGGYQHPYNYGGGNHGYGHGANGYRHTGISAGHKDDGAKKGIGIGIGFNKKFEITWPSFKKGTKY